MAWLIAQAIISVVMIIGGLVTESLYLAVIGLIWLVGEIFQIVTFKKKKEKERNLQNQMGAQQFWQNIDANQGGGQPNMQNVPNWQQSTPQLGQSGYAQAPADQTGQYTQAPADQAGRYAQEPVPNPLVWLAVPKNIKITLVGEARSQNHWVFLNSEFAGESKKNEQTYISTRVRKNLLQIQNHQGEWAEPFFFEVVDDSSADGELFIGKDTSGNPLVLLSAGLSFKDIVKGIRKVDSLA